MTKMFIITVVIYIKALDFSEYKKRSLNKLRNQDKITILEIQDFLSSKGS